MNFKYVYKIIPTILSSASDLGGNTCSKDKGKGFFKRVVKMMA
jgi:hypothetical protein